MQTYAGECVHLTSTHRPFDTRVFQKECRSLAEAGYKVTLIVPHTQDETVHGVHIKAIEKPTSGKDRLTKTTRAVYKAALLENPDALFHFHDAELLPFMLVLKLKGRRVIYDAHENTPHQILYQHWIPSIFRRPVSLTMRLLEFIGSLVFDRIIAATPVIAARYPSRKTITVHNYPRLGPYDTATPPDYEERLPLVVYAGGLSAVRGIREMIDAVTAVRTKHEIRLALAGTFYPAALEAECQQTAGWKFVDFKGWISQEAIVDLLGKARIGLVLLHPTAQYRDSYPTKLFEYMAAGLPVIASDFPRFRTLVADQNCTLFVDPQSSAALAKAIVWILEHPEEATAMGARGRTAVRQHFNWTLEAARLIKLYAALAAD